MHALVVLAVTLGLSGASLPRPLGPWPTAAGPDSALQSSDSSTTEVEVVTDAPRYRPGQPIEVTVTNRLAETVFLLGGQTYCSPILVVRWSGEQWQLAPSCPPAEPLTYLPVAPGAARALALDPQTRAARVEGPTVSAPVQPGSTSQDLRALPTTTPATGPVREISEGTIPTTPTPAPVDLLTPGCYRLLIRYSVGGTGQEWQTRYSAPFAVGDPSGC